MQTNLDDRASSFLNKWMSALVALVILVQIAFWLPHYLFWPYWADHDVFANAARAWTDGRLPYRDTRLNNFPGTIYLFWLIGRIFGWGRPALFFGLDAVLLFTFGGMLSLWSRRRFGFRWPGLLGFMVYLSFSLNLDYAHAAQRDWHAPALAVLALLTLQTFGGRTSLGLAAITAAAAFTIRPQVILLGPALVLSAGWLDSSRRWQDGTRRSMLWMGVVVGCVALFFLPLLVAGVLDDFLDSLRLISPGSGYNQVTFTSIIKRWIEQASETRWWVLVFGLLLLVTTRVVGDLRRLGLIWLLALGGVSFYQPLSPVAHSYLDIPLAVIGSVGLAVILGFLANEAVGPASIRLLAVGGLVAMGGTTFRPTFVQLGPTLEAVRCILDPDRKSFRPPGYRHGSVATSAFYPWDDYQATLAYLRTETGPTTQVANLLKGDPAIVSMVDRQSALPAESIAWLRMVRHTDDATFAASLENSHNSVVVWDPEGGGPDPNFSIQFLNAVVRREYQPAARFGVIEVWRRKVREN